METDYKHDMLRACAEIVTKVACSSVDDLMKIDLEHVLKMAQWAAMYEAEMKKQREAANDAVAKGISDAFAKAILEG